MKILLFSPYFYPYLSGLTTYHFKILSYLARSNEITVLTFLHVQNLTVNEKINGMNIVRMPFNFKISKGFISTKSLIYFLRYAKKSDLIILNIPNFEGLPLAIVGKLLNKKIVSVFLCEVFLGSDLLSKIVNFFLSISAYYQLFLSHIIVALTKDYNQSLSIGKSFKNKIRTVLPPIEKLTIDRNKLHELKKLKGKNIWIGYAGRISQEKGLEYLINSINSFSHSGLSRIDSGVASLPRMTNVSLVFAGPYAKDVVGGEKYYLKIKYLLDQYRISYHFFGHLSSGNLGAFYKSIDVLTLPSINQTEAFGMVQAEAMLLGTPVIASNLPGVRVPIQLTKMGEIVEPKNANQLSQAIEKVLKNKSKYSNDLLVKKAQDIFDIKKTYKFYDNLLTF